ncbi:MAG: glyoxylate/hydroxypyruvate reductase A [Rhodospirillales bacterium]|nr:glyoxylate/hydroxypyruvate reductase A [Rhodospirillales bacterium]MCB9996181.1 glyoxylate/hydroxypyruvate reductase A [Rhodospirillales bacterium]
MAILFRPSFPIDHTHWIPVLKTVFAGQDFRIAPNIGNPADIHYIIGWRLSAGDRDGWPNLKAVLTLGAGVNQYTGHPEFPQNARLIRMLDPGLRQSMTEYVTGFVLRFHRQIDQYAVPGDIMDWNPPIPALAKDRTVGIMGIGDLGRACLDALKPFGFQLKGWSRTPKTYEGMRCFAGPKDLQAFLNNTDILVCLLPLTPETRGILNKDTLGQLPSGAYVINAGRGQHIVDHDLLTMLDKGHIAHAALDVFSKEPLPQDHVFHAHPRVIVTPHIAAISMPHTAGPVLKESIDLLESGKMPAGLVDMECGY